MANQADIIPDFVGGDYGRIATRNKQPYKGIIFHVTGKPDLQSELDYMSKPDPNRPGQYGYSFLIDRDGKIYQTAPYGVRTNHIMPNAKYGLSNNNALGVAFVGGDLSTTPEQIASGKLLAGQLSSQFRIDPKNVVTHGELDASRANMKNSAGNEINEGRDFITAYRGGQPGQPSQPTVTAAPSRPATITPGTTLNSSPMDLVATLESGNRNIPQQIHDINTEKGTPAGGYFQIIDPTWQRYAGAAGVDLKQFPTAMSAPRDVQAKVASAIPFREWGPNTVKAVTAKYPWIDTNQTLGSIQSQALNAQPSGSPTVAAGGPSAGPASTAFGSAGNLPGFEANSPGAKMTAEGLKSMGLGGKPAEPPPMPAPMQLQAQATGGPMMLGPGQQNMMGRTVAQQVLAQQGFLTQPQLAYAFTGAPPQQPTALPGMMTGMPSMPGTTLNSPSQLQMALMQGVQSPYDAYGQGQV